MFLRKENTLTHRLEKVNFALVVTPVCFDLFWWQQKTIHIENFEAELGFSRFKFIAL